VIIEIISENPKLPEALDELSMHNEKEFKKAGFSFNWIKDVNNKNRYLAYTTYERMSSQVAFESFGKMLIIREMRKQFKKFDSGIVINEIKELK
jgi:hypothetical protein